MIEADGSHFRVSGAQLKSVNAYSALIHYLRLENPFPILDDWAAEPDTLLYLANLVALRRPRVILELGSGVSTLVLARSAQLSSPTSRVVALEHSKLASRRTNDLLELHGVTEHADVRLAPLSDAGLPGHDTAWYSPAAIEDLEKIDAMFVDGPPRWVGRQSRFPAVPLLVNRLDPDCVVVLDDAEREDEAACLTQWSHILPTHMVITSHFVRGLGALEPAHLWRD